MQLKARHTVAAFRNLVVPPTNKTRSTPLVTTPAVERQLSALFCTTLQPECCYALAQTFSGGSNGSTMA
jgi:hypothetical protein